eukprot:scaffold77840_cov69-Phaeocystis_antarctica.AAC.3
MEGLPLVRELRPPWEQLQKPPPSRSPPPDAAMSDGPGAVGLRRRSGRRRALARGSASPHPAYASLAAATCAHLDLE